MRFSRRKSDDLTPSFRKVSRKKSAARCKNEGNAKGRETSEMKRAKREIARVRMLTFIAWNVGLRVEGNNIAAAVAERV